MIVIFRDCTSNCMGCTKYFCLNTVEDSILPYQSIYRESLRFLMRRVDKKSRSNRDILNFTALIDRLVLFYFVSPK